MMKTRGFTLVEILVAIGIMSLIIGIGGISYRDFSNRQQVSSATREIRSALRLAQTRAFSGEKPAGCTGTLLSYSFRTDRQRPVGMPGGPTPIPTATPAAPQTPGLRGEYYNGRSFTTLVNSRIDGTVNFNWGGSPMSGVGSDEFSVRWSGKIRVPTTGTYTFFSLHDDSSRVWVNNQQLINDWTGGAPRERSGTISLSGSTDYDIRMEYAEHTAGAVARLSWQGPGISKRVIPQANLYTTGGAGAPGAPAATPACASVQSMPAPGFVPFSSSSNDFTRTYSPPSIPGAQIMGVVANFHDNGGPYHAYRTITLSNGTTSNSMTTSCSSQPGGWVDVCGSGIHDYTMPNYMTSPSVSISSFSVRFRRTDDDDGTPQFVSLTWRYRMLSCATPTPVTTPVPPGGATPPPQSYIVEAVCSGVANPIVVQTLKIPPGINLSNFETITFKPVEGGTNIPSGQRQTITATSPVNNYSESVIVESSGDVQ